MFSLSLSLSSPLKAILLLALLQPIVCPTVLIRRQQRSPSPVQKQPVSNSSGSSEETAANGEPKLTVAGGSSVNQIQLNESLLSIFRISPYEGITMFADIVAAADEPASPSPSPSPSPQAVQMPNVQPIDQSSSQSFAKQSFKSTAASEDNAPTRTITRHADHDPGRIIFPSRDRPNYIESPSYNFKPDMCLEKGQTFCTEVANYTNLINFNNNLKLELSKYKLLFGEDEGQPLNISNRMNPDSDVEDLCKSKQLTIYPQSGETRDSNWMLIINDRKDYRQGVRIEECMNAGEPCNFHDIFPNTYVAICQQNYVYRTMVGLTNDKIIKTDKFKIPSCCKCVVKRKVT